MATSVRKPLAEQPKKPRRRIRRFAFRSLIVLIALAVAHAWWGAHEMKKLRAKLEQIRAEREPAYAEDLIEPPLADSDNAAVLLRTAHELIEAHGNYDEQAGFWDGVYPQVLTDANIKAMLQVVETNRAGLDRIKEATKKTGVRWGFPDNTREPLLTALLPRLYMIRGNACVLRIPVLAFHGAGNDREALRHIEQMYFISKSANRQPCLVSRLVAIGCSAIGNDMIERIAVDLRVDADEKSATREQVRRVMAYLLDDAPILAAQRKCFVIERCVAPDTALGTLDGRVNPAFNESFWKEVPSPISRFVFKPFNARSAVLVMDAITRLIEATDARSWPEFRDRTNDWMPPEVGDHGWTHILARIVTPDLRDTMKRHYLEQTHRHLAAVALAWRLYTIDHNGTPPSRLQDLLGTCLLSIPEDPMSGDNGRLQFSDSEGVPRVYSIGIDGRDDGGRERAADATPSKPAPEDIVVYLKRATAVTRPAGQ